jgi:hypothetical protein
LPNGEPAIIFNLRDDPIRHLRAAVTDQIALQFVLEIFNNGPGPFTVRAQDTLNFSSIPLRGETIFTGTVPTGQPIYTYSPAAVSLGTLTETFGPDALSFLVGTGTVPFGLSLGTTTVDQFSGPTTNAVLAFSGVSGSVTADYAYTPVPTPEPATLGVAGLGLIASGVFLRKRRQ